MRMARTSVGDGLPLVILHGLFGSGRNWGAIAKRLAARGWRVITPDLRNHGDSPWDDTMDTPAMAGDIRALLDEVAPDESAVVAGHSMGGKAAMWLALSHPDRVRGLIAVDVAPVAYRHDLADLARALLDLPLDRVNRRVDADTLLADVIPEPGLRQFLLQNLVLPGPDDADGPRWRANLRVLADRMGEIAGWPDPPAGCRFDGPTLVLSGGASDYVRPEHHAGVRALFPAARFAVVEGAGHWVHAQAPDATVSEIAGFLDALPSP